ncbi:uncharacterized protein LOC134235522 isoform X2 [Saccostrea cucullata]|uniref:uncharacterized protein LOC134235522 isoform X2 n=1 Tax=Saccostrea cuccullata TaxID=36930 RepID=UPI002ED38B75
MEFYCLNCKHNMCLQCKEKHAIDVQTAKHYVWSNEEKNEYMFTEQVKKRQPDRSVNIPVCSQCKYKLNFHNIDITHLMGIEPEIRIMWSDYQDEGPRCYQCRWREEFTCSVCRTGLCLECKDIQTIDIDTIDYNIVIYREKCEFILKEIFERHPSKMYNIFCNSCKLPVCFNCKKHIENKIEERETSLETQHYVMNTPTLELSTQSKVRQCFKCRGDAEFYCFMCRNDLCEQCKEIHTIDLDTIDHHIVIYREKFKISKQEFCERHPDNMYDTFCQTCKLPICVQCRDPEHKKHELIDLGNAYQTNRQQHKEIFHNIRWKTQCNYSCFLLEEIKSDLKTRQSEIPNLYLKMKTKAQTLKDFIDSGIFAIKVRYSKLQQRNRKVIRYLTIMDKNEKILEQSANKPVQFLSLRKKTCVREMYGTSRATQQFLLFAAEEINRKDIIALLTDIKIIATDKRQLKNECLLKQVISPVLHRSVEITGLSGVIHISTGALDLVCISDWENNLLLTNKEGDTDIYKLPHINISKLWGLHTFNRARDLIFIDSFNNINKLTKYDNSVTQVIKKREPWTLRCVYCSPCNGDLLVGMCRYDTNTAKVIRYNETGKLIQTIQYYNMGQVLYKSPEYITENRNGDVVVSDWNCAVVVTDRDGRHRFSYTGLASGSQLLPRGICTDTLSNILVCDRRLNAIHVIDWNRYFLAFIRTKQDGIESPHGLGYQANSHLLWVGSYNSNRVCVYRYLCRQN